MEKASDVKKEETKKEELKMDDKQIERDIKSTSN